MKKRVYNIVILILYFVNFLLAISALTFHEDLNIVNKIVYFIIAICMYLCNFLVAYAIRRERDCKILNEEED